MFIVFLILGLSSEIIYTKWNIEVEFVGSLDELRLCFAGVWTSAEIMAFSIQHTCAEIMAELFSCGIVHLVCWIDPCRIVLSFCIMAFSTQHVIGISTDARVYLLTLVYLRYLDPTQWQVKTWDTVQQKFSETTDERQNVAFLYTRKIVDNLAVARRQRDWS